MVSIARRSLLANGPNSLSYGPAALTTESPGRKFVLSPNSQYKLFIEPKTADLQIRKGQYSSDGIASGPEAVVFSVATRDGKNPAIPNAVNKDDNGNIYAKLNITTKGVYVTATVGNSANPVNVYGLIAYPERQLGAGLIELVLNNDGSIFMQQNGTTFAAINTPQQIQTATTQANQQAQQQQQGSGPQLPKTATGTGNQPATTAGFSMPLLLIAAGAAYYFLKK